MFFRPTASIIAAFCFCALASNVISAANIFPAGPATEAFTQSLQTHQANGRLAQMADDPALVELARARGREMRALLEANPAEFIRQAMPGAERAQLPAALQNHIERRIKQRGSFSISCVMAPPPDAEDNDHAHDHPTHYTREVRIGKATYRAFVANRWLDQNSVREATIEGVVLDDAIALADAPTPQEQADAGEPVYLDAPSTSGTNTVLYMIARFSDETTDPIATNTALARMLVVNDFWKNNSSGQVGIRGLVNPDQVVDIVAITLPQPMSYASTYNANFATLLNDARTAASAQGYNYSSYNLDLVITSNPGGGFSYAGRAYVGSQGAHFLSGYSTLRTVGHEMGHNLGLRHANYWRTDATLPFGKDTNPGGYVADSSNAEWIEYGHYFSLMSAQSGGEFDDATKPHYAGAEKVYLGWLSGSEVKYGATNGTYRLFRHDHRETAGTPRTIRIETPATDYTGYGRYYWLNYRYTPWSSAQNWVRNGLQVDVCRTSYGSDGATQLDMTPYSKDSATPFYNPSSPPGSYWTIDQNDKLDGALIVGRTYSDAAAGIHFTPIATGNNGTNEEYIDVVVNLGSFPANRAPVIASFTASTNQVNPGQTVNLSVTASDPDGDALAYAWDFDQVQIWTASGLNTNTAAKSWPSAGQYRVKVTVSDMKGGIASESVIVTVGTPALNGQIWGRVLWAGQPVSEARISATVGSTVLQAWTDGDGSYVLTDLDTSTNYTLKCMRDGLTFAAQFSNPVSFGGSTRLFAKDFLANESLPGGGGGPVYTISGQVTYAGTGVAGVEVRAGGMLKVTDAAGNYQFTNCPSGSYTVTAQYPGWTFTPASRSVTITSANSTGNNFARVSYSFSGRLYLPATTEPPVAPIIYLSNGKSATAVWQGGSKKYYTYSLSGVPAGQFSLSVDHSDYAFVPTNGWSNPVPVSGNATADFHGFANATDGGITGRITERGLPLAAAVVEARISSTVAGSALTDSDGYYLIPSLTNATYTVVPIKAGYTFSPASTTSTVPGTRKDFTATGPSLPPAVAGISATPSSITTPGTITLAVSATGSGTLTYSWDTLTSPGPVSFSVNDSSAAATTVVSVNTPGSYTFRARIKDGNGFITTTNVNATGTTGPAAMAITPYEIQVIAGQTQPFTAKAWDSVGNVLGVTPTWTITGGGSINSTGLLTALVAGGPYQVMAVAGSLSATSTFWVLPGAGGLASVSIQAISNSVSEGDPSNLVFRLSRTNIAGTNLTVNLAVSGTADYPDDYSVTGANAFDGAAASVIIEAGQTNADLIITAVDDAVAEMTESVTLTLEEEAGSYTTINPGTATGNILDNDATAPSITQQPESQMAPRGSNVTFIVVATGSEPLTYQWLKDEGELLDATNATLVLNSVQSADAGDYIVVVGNLAGAVTSVVAQLTVVLPPEITTHPQSQTIILSSNANFAVAAIGTPPLFYQWRLGGGDLTDATNVTLTITNAQLADAGEYTVVITNSVGAITSAAAVLTINQPPVPGTNEILRLSGTGAKVLISTVLGVDLEGDPIALESVDETSDAGGTIITNAPWIIYTPPAGHANGDAFHYLVRDSRGAYANGTILVTVATNLEPSLNFTTEDLGGGSLRLRFSGIPDFTYWIQYTTNLVNPAWQTLSTNVASDQGLFEFIDHPPAGSSRIYRSTTP